MAKKSPVSRPTKKTENEILFASSQAAKGWRDLVATRRNAMTDARDFLTRTPTAVTPANDRLRGELATVSYHGTTYDRWQHKPSLRDGARIWFFVDGQTVLLEDVHTAHPNETK
ncbi:conserved hypothetical protein [Cellulomonas flavigena DSM 20109]|uniref:Uncharacterized protein n=1 Tax=Cellulomonas flavigena (strain ATCC 482 / DSM 20109 / BCRC 11376 / JCM 18109 / NBRC 3775 / NCIMB 8073 / NRS 134) TaxID=446466 RepID=D5UIL6_CELFN|nr:hypothetical protein [Cellulomonas flavigena]ADG73515.1 conserved hypothetical protein [Cellulomonas flavigena DSM 20109]